MSFIQQLNEGSQQVLTILGSQQSGSDAVTQLLDPSQGVVAVTMSLISVILEFVPGLAPRFEALDAQYKRVVIGIILLIVSCVTVAFGCYSGDPTFGGYCTNAGVLEIVSAVAYHFFVGGMASMTTHTYFNKAVRSNDSNSQVGVAVKQSSPKSVTPIKGEDDDE